ncbi:hypothetical protein [Shimia thalassica]|uniref:hypothetical protein n=1 Tax=Shimia thalassica TaxID=1715693 RepID=UPI002495A810|nr:hypothetical protein [Shimia thalassica]
MSPTITLCHEPPDKDRMNALLGEYYDLMIQRIVDMGGKDPSGDGDAIEEFWQEIDCFLPPKAGFMWQEPKTALLSAVARSKLWIRHVAN